MKNVRMDKRVVGIVAGISILLIVVGVLLASGRQSQTPANPAAPGANKTDLQLSSSDWAKGKATAPVTLVEYGDFQCPACAAYHAVVETIMNEMPDTVRLVFRHFPLTNIHDKAWTAAKVAEGAGRLGKFWEMYDVLYENQEQWGEKSVAEFDKLIDGYAKQAGVDPAQLRAEMNKPEVEQRVKAGYDSANKLNLNGTPTFFVNGVLISLPGSLQRFKQVIQDTAAVAPTPSPEVHEHADLAVFAGGKRLNLSDNKYNEKNPDIHIHDANGEIIHKHSAGATLGVLVESLGIGAKPTNLWVNGKKYEGNWEDYKFNDLDRLVLADSELAEAQVNTVSDKACIYSEKCPARGTPPTENCVGGLNTPCEVD